MRLALTARWMMVQLLQEDQLRDHRRLVLKEATLQT
jgi:hypothetical protein